MCFYGARQTFQMHVRWHSALVNAIKTDQKMFKITYFQILRKKHKKNHTFHFQEEQQLVVEKASGPLFGQFKSISLCNFCIFCGPKSGPKHHFCVPMSTRFTRIPQKWLWTAIYQSILELSKSHNIQFRLLRGTQSPGMCTSNLS